MIHLHRLLTIYNINMKLHYLLIIAASFYGCSSLSQEAKIHTIEPVSGYYKEYQMLDSDVFKGRANLDTISFPLDGRTFGKQFIGIEPAYLSEDDVNVLKTSLKFPANSSVQTRAELDYLLQWESKRTKENEARAMEIARIGYWPSLDKGDDANEHNLEHLFWEYREVVTKKYDLKDYPFTVKLLRGVTRDMRIMEFTVKYHLLRARPYHLEPRLNPMARISSPSFASGHTLWAYIQAFTWSELLPSKRKEFLNIAYEVGESREIMGIHYPSDEESARVLAHEMLLLMSKNQQFKADLTKAKLEWN